MSGEGTAKTTQHIVAATRRCLKPIVTMNHEYHLRQIIHQITGECAAQVQRTLK